MDYDFNIINKAERMDKIISVCLGKPSEEELPQTFSVEDVVVHQMHMHTGMKTDLLEAKLNNQIQE